MSAHGWIVSRSRLDLRGIYFEPSDAQVHAAAEHLSSYLAKVTGVRLPVAATQAPETLRQAFLVCTDAWQTRLGLAAARDAEGTDTFRLVAFPDSVRLALIGANARACFYAACELLERFAGVRWLTPWATHIPQRRSVTIDSQIAETHHPAFALRGFHICASGRDARGRVRAHYDEKTLLWMRANRMNMKFLHNAELDAVAADLARLGIMPLCLGNAFDGFCPPSLFDTHPEYFPLIGGRRVGRGVIKRCLASPGFRALLGAEAVRFLEAHPATETVAIQPSDGLGWCECAGCRSMDLPGETETDTVSGRVYEYARRVAAAVRRRAPGKWVSMSSYSGWVDPPPSLSRIDNLILALTLSRNHAAALDAPRSPTNRPIWRRLEQCTRIAGRVVAYDYFQMHGMPLPACTALGASLEAMHRQGVAGYFAEVCPDPEMWQTWMLPAYFAARKTWNIRLQPDACIRDFCRHFYGAAGADMTAYFLELEAAFADDSREYGAFQGQDAAQFLDASVAARCREHLAAAALCPRRRTRAAARVAAQAALTEKWIEACVRIRNGDFGPTELMALPVHPDTARRTLAHAAAAPLLQRAVLQPLGSVRAGYTASDLLLLFHCLESEPQHVLADADPGNAAATSHLDLFLCPCPESGVYFQFMVNAAGARFMQRCRGRTWDSGYRAEIDTEIRSRQNGWEVLLRVPCRALEVQGIAAGDAWLAGLNFKRQTHAGRNSGGWPRGGAFHDIRKFGTLRFAARPDSARPPSPHIPGAAGSGTPFE